MNIYTRQLVQLTDPEWEQVKGCNMGNRGSMRSVIQRLRDEGRKDARVVMVWKRSELLGCTLIFKRKADREDIIYSYVRPEYRRQGIGTKMVKHARRGRPKPLQACLWDGRSREFYDELIAKGVCVDSKGRWQ